MKFLKVLFVAFLCFSSATFAATSEINITVNGMVCAFCAQGIEKKFHANPTVSDVKVNLSEKSVKLKLKDGQQLDDGTIKKTLTDAGYSVEKIERK